MPRPVRAQGRPGTKVIPTNWNASHAPVLDKTHRGHCVIVDPKSGGDLVYDENGKTSKRTAPDAKYDGACRVQVQQSQDARTVVGDQQTTTIEYLVAINLLGDGVDRDEPVAEPHVGDRVTVTQSGDASLDGQSLTVTSVAVGTERFERDLFCVLDESH